MADSLLAQQAFDGADMRARFWNWSAVAGRFVVEEPKSISLIRPIKIRLSLVQFS